MKCFFTAILQQFSFFVVFSQPTANAVQADVKKDLGVNCIAVTLVGAGANSTEYVNNGYSTFYRMSVNVKLKTDLPGVSKLLKGTAKYNYNNGKYIFNQYAPGTSEYIGLSAPDTAKIRALVLSMPNYGLAGSAATIVDVINFSFLPNPVPLWHSVLSVSITAEMIYTKKLNNTTLETFKEPFSLRLYRTSATTNWESLVWLKPNFENDPRRKELIGKETIGAYKMSMITTLMDKAKTKASQKQTAALPKVNIPQMNTIVDIMKWYHALLMQGDYANVEAATLQILHPFNFNKSTNLINSNGEEIFKYLKIALTNDYATYNKQNCLNPQIDSKNDTEISWWNKDKSRVTKMKIKIENGRWYLYDLSIYVWGYEWESRAKTTMAVSCK